VSFKKFGKFSGVGIFNAVIGLSLLYLFLEVLHWNLYLTYLLVYLIGITISYILNSKITFKKKINTRDVRYYFFYYLVGLAFGMTVLYIIDVNFQFGNFFKTLLVIPPRTLFTYFLLNKFLYK